MDSQQTREEAYLRNLEQINELIDHIRMAGLQALNEYQQHKMLNLTTRQGILITKVARLTKQLSGGVTLSTLARELRMSVSATSHLVDTMEELKLLKRDADAEDRRSIRITLSATGKQCADVARAGMLRAIRKLTSLLSEEENERRVQIIDKVYQHATAAIN